MAAFKKGTRVPGLVGYPSPQSLKGTVRRQVDWEGETGETVPGPHCVKSITPHEMFYTTQQNPELER